MIKCIIPLVKKAGFKYAVIDATNAFTSKAAEFNNFSPIYKVLAKDVMWNGKPYYIHIKEPHGEWIYYVKNLEEE